LPGSLSGPAFLELIDIFSGSHQMFPDGPLGFRRIAFFNGIQNLAVLSQGIPDFLGTSYPL
jgi:hypothetical protein